MQCVLQSLGLKGSTSLATFAVVLEAFFSVFFCCCCCCSLKVLSRGERISEEMEKINELESGENARYSVSTCYTPQTTLICLFTCLIADISFENYIPAGKTKRKEISAVAVRENV